MLQLLQDMRRLFEEAAAALNLFIDQLRLHPVADVRLGKEQEGRAGQRKHRDDEHPGQLGRRVHLAVEQVDHHAEGEQAHHIDQDRQLVREVRIGGDEDQDLQDCEQGNDKKTAEHQAQEAPFDRFGQPDDAFFVVHDTLPPLTLNHRFLPFFFPRILYHTKALPATPL